MAGASVAGHLPNREGLLARLDGVTFKLPPLRQRVEEIVPLFLRFLDDHSGALAPPVEPRLLETLCLYDWPFNVRELESCVKRAVALTDGTQLDTVHLPDAISEHMKTYGDKQRYSAPSAVPPPPVYAGNQPQISSAPPPPMDGAVSSGSRRGAPTEEELRSLLERHRGNVAAVGRELGKERMQVRRWLKRYNIDLSQYRSD